MANLESNAVRKSKKLKQLEKQRRQLAHDNERELEELARHKMQLAHENTRELEHYALQKMKLEHENKLDDIKNEINSLKLSARTPTLLSTPPPSKSSYTTNTEAPPTAASSTVAPSAVAPPTVAPPTLPPASAFDLKALRKEPEAAASASAQLTQYGLAEFLDGMKTFGEKQGNKKLKSGLEDKPTDTIVKKLRWPHTCLKFRFSPQGNKFTDLDLPLLCAGEIAIISDPTTSDTEKAGRLVLLSTTRYNSKIYKWEAVRSLHCACLGAIERGDKQWGDSFADYEPHMLFQHSIRTPPTQSSTSKNSGNSTSSYSATGDASHIHWFCRPWQIGKCSFKAEHEGTVNGVRRTMEHICAVCYQKNEGAKLHPQSSEECPYKNIKK